MPARRKKTKTRRRTGAHVITVQRFVVYFVILFVAGFLSLKVGIPLLNKTEDVLGVSTLLARGGPGGPGGPGEHGLGRGLGNGGQSPEHGNKFTAPNIPFASITPLPSGGEERVKSMPPGLLRHQEDDQNVDQSATDGGGLEIPEKHLGARIHFPHTIDLATNTLIITTPGGVKTVVLPDKAIQNMITKGIISKIGGHVIESSGSAEEGDGGEGGSTESASITSGGDQATADTGNNIDLTEENGLPVYKVHGSLNKRLLGFIPVDVNKTVTVSADTGEVQSTSLPLFDRFLDLFSL